jgi:capsular polysaccharide export protein
MSPAKVAVYSKGILDIPHLDRFLEAEIAAARAGLDGCTAVAGWGLRPTAARARRTALRHGLRYLALEDGFLRSIELGPREPPLSLVVDDLGIYYDAARPSRLEEWVRQGCTADQAVRAQALVMGWREAQVSKYNHQRDPAGDLPSRYVLAVDQTSGDASVRYGLAGPEHFRRMLDAAVAENPDCTVLLKIHPDVMAGKRRGYFDPHKAQQDSRIKVLAEDVHPAALIEKAEAIYTVTSQLGFEGLLWGKRVRCFGMPFYAGWGLTEDELPSPERRGAASLEALVHAALVAYPRYIDPETGERCEPERLIAWMGLQRRMRARYPAKVYAAGFSRWKRPLVRFYFAGSTVRFVRSPRMAPAGATLAVWGRREVAADVNLIRMEDGFLRSVGLGADLVRPLSWVMDNLGIYYDATRPSRLEQLLQTTVFDASLLARAAALRETIRRHGLTKYNVGAGHWQRPAAGRVILVPGQVESDASIAWGSPGIKRNIELLQAVRVANPDAHVIYKPHPDVVAGLRKRGAGEEEAARFCDETVIDCAMGELLDGVDEVHTLTSLAGFEALLRDKKVVCYGQPFYAGWGLTRDIHPLPRRTRRLSVDELVAGVLLLYPVYVSRATGRFTTVERALHELLAWREQVPQEARWRRWLRPVLSLRKR